MKILLVTIILILTLIIFIQRSKNVKTSKDIKYMEVKLQEIMENNSEERIKVFTSNEEVKKLIGTINITCSNYSCNNRVISRCWGFK